jgi:hypothetical protein
MKNLVDFLTETRLSDNAEKLANKYLIKYHSNNALEFKNKAEKDNWILDMNYDNWTSGEEVVLKYTKKGETLFVTYSLSKNEEYKGELNDNELVKLKIIDNAEYYKK